ncbi:MAG: HK97 gp10 family phage protein, partial [Calditrichaeota bacterium]|nr:HK97 gp10 family phage protein [Calditrichota bacterium]
MASPTIEISFNDKDFGPVLIRTTAQVAERAVKKTAAAIEAEAVRRAPKATEELSRQIFTQHRGSGFDTEAIVKSPARYSIFVHEGTGIYGPFGAPIIPKNKQALYWPGAAHPVKSVKGMRPRPFLKEAFDEKGPLLRKFVFGDNFR